jgi:glycosyltransferase involved in cell wall biosynthesis
VNKKICFVVTVSLAAKNFLQWSFEDMHNAGYDISLLCDMDEEYMNSLPAYVHKYPLKMARGIDVAGSLKAIKYMTELFKREQFDIVQYSTPNASLYASIASKKAKIPVRLYCQWGMVYLGFEGIKRKIFKTIEKIICKNSTDVQPDSKGNLDFCRANGFYDEGKSRIVWNGCANGLDVDKFDIKKKQQYRQEIRSKFKFDDDTVVLGFLGRIGRDKGFNELMLCFKKLKDKYENIKLLYVGYNEKPETVDQELLKYFEECPDIVSTNGWVDDPQRYLSAMDIFLFPSYREGFGNVVIEAEAMGVPVVVSDIPGPQNGMVDGKTGFKVPARQWEPLYEKAGVLIEDSELREKFGLEGSTFVVDNFNSKILIKKIIENRNWLLNRG